MIMPTVGNPQVVVVGVEIRSQLDHQNNMNSYNNNSILVNETKRDLTEKPKRWFSCNIIVNRRINQGKIRSRQTYYHPVHLVR